MVIVPGSASTNLALNVAENLGDDVLFLNLRDFPDGEWVVQFDVENFKEKRPGEEFVVIQTTYPNQDRNLLQLLVMIDTLFDLFGVSPIVVVPYLAFSRQDKRFLPGQAITAKTILNFIRDRGAKRLITVDVHNEDIFSLVEMDCVNVTAMGEIGKHLLKMCLKNPVVISPDEGAINHAKVVAEILGCEYNFFKKKRSRTTGEINVEKRDIEVKGRDVVVLDDIISTGGTVAEAVKIVKNLGALKAYVACTHGLLVKDAFKRIIEAGAEKIFGTDTIQSEISVISVAPVIAETLKK
ncbi:MAG: ribose-phosphate diphosphokinase [Candidatus Hodarchaeota archaeon]